MLRGEEPYSLFAPRYSLLPVTRGLVMEDGMVALAVVRCVTRQLPVLQNLAPLLLKWLLE